MFKSNDVLRAITGGGVVDKDGLNVVKTMAEATDVADAAPLATIIYEGQWRRVRTAVQNAPSLDAEDAFERAALAEIEGEDEVGIARALRRADCRESARPVTLEITEAEYLTNGNSVETVDPETARDLRIWEGLSQADRRRVRRALATRPQTVESITDVVDALGL